MKNLKKNIKLIKLSDTHYIVVDDSKIDTGYWFWIPIKRSIEKCVRRLLIIKGGGNDIEQWKVTHSTEPLEEFTDNEGIKRIGWVKIKLLTVEEAEEAINGYSVEKICKDEVKRRDDLSSNNRLTVSERDFAERWMKIGFKECQELTKDKLFTLNKVKGLLFEVGTKMRYKGVNYTHYFNYKNVKEEVDKVIKPFLPKTEWDIEFDGQGKIKLV